MLNTQITTYTVIVSAIILVLVGLYIIDASKDTKKLVSAMCGLVVLLIIIIYYFVNVSYLQESFFTAPPEIAAVTIGTTDSANIMNRLDIDLTAFNTSVIASLQIAMGAIPLKETTDFYNELNGVIEIEKKNKEDIANVLSHKKTLGYSNIDILKYENNNMKVYIFVLLTTMAIFTLLYIVSLYVPEEYNNLIVFVGVIFAIILFAYYIIFTNALVRTKSYHKYWGPSSVDDK